MPTSQEMDQVYSAAPGYHTGYTTETEIITESKQLLGKYEKSTTNQGDEKHKIFRQP